MISGIWSGMQSAASALALLQADTLDTVRGLAGDTAAAVTPRLASFWDWLVNDGPAQAVALAVLIGGFLILRLLRAFISGMLQSRNASPTAMRNILARLVSGTWSVFLLFLTAILILPFVDFIPEHVAAGISRAFVVALILQAAVWLRVLVGCLTAGYFEGASGPPREGGGAAAFSLIRTLSGIVIWSVAILMIFTNLGIEIAPIIAGLGVGGLAIGLAAQNIFKDLFASLSIIFDQPFVRGDFIAFDAGANKGEVERIGMKTTRLRAVSGEEIIVGNAQLLDKEVRNYRRMVARRAQATLGVLYQTPHDTLAGIPALVERAIGTVDGVRFDRCALTSFADSAIQFETVFWIDDRRYPVFIDKQQGVLLAIHKAFEDAGIAFAYPTRSIHIETMPA